MESPFKRCSMCGKHWSTRAEFLDDLTLHLDGHQWNKRKVQAGHRADGVLIFTHRIKECGTSLAVGVTKFRGREYGGPLTGTERKVPPYRVDHAIAHQADALTAHVQRRKP